MSKSYKILGIDPGTQFLGYAILQVDGPELMVLDIGVIKLTIYKEQQDKLKEIYLQLQEIIETYIPAQMAIEAPFYGKNVQSMLKLGRAQGVAIAAGITMGVQITEYSPKKIKMSITGNGNASKEQVSKMLGQILKVDMDSHSLDATDALAAAVTHYHNMGITGSTKKVYKSWKSFIKDHPDKSLK